MSRRTMCGGDTFTVAFFDATPERGRSFNGGRPTYETVGGLKAVDLPGARFKPLYPPSSIANANSQAPKAVLPEFVAKGSVGTGVAKIALLDVHPVDYERLRALLFSEEDAPDEKWSVVYGGNARTCDITVENTLAVIAMTAGARLPDKDDEYPATFYGLNAVHLGDAPLCMAEYSREHWQGTSPCVSNFLGAVSSLAGRIATFNRPQPVVA